NQVFCEEICCPLLDLLRVEVDLDVERRAGPQVSASYMPHFMSQMPDQPRRTPPRARQSDTGSPGNAKRHAVYTLGSLRQRIQVHHRDSEIPGVSQQTTKSYAFGFCQHSLPQSIRVTSLQPEGRELLCA